ncbi:MAG TPA: hypothetical protein ENG69_02565 [Candidatus Korarchaeota archaeon]|nr:hypothetical protein [Candidatus Korarchaeota archaeon]
MGSVGEVRQRIRAVHAFCSGLPGGLPVATDLAASLAGEPYAHSFREALLRAAVEGDPLERALEESLSRHDGAFREAILSLARGADLESSLEVLRRFAAAELERESRDISLRVGVRTTLSYAAMTLLVTASVIGSIPPESMAPLSLALSSVMMAVSALRWVRWRRGSP